MANTTTNEQNIQLREISERQLVARINREIEPNGEFMYLRHYDEPGANLGRYYTIDAEQGFMTCEGFDDLEGYGRELGVLREWECLADDHSEWDYENIVRDIHECDYLLDPR